MIDTYWNGLPTEAIRGTAIVSDDGRFPQYWARTDQLIGQRIPVVRVVLDGVNYGGGIDYLDNRDGSGWLKVTEGQGSPMYGHRTVQIEAASFIPEEIMHISESDDPIKRVPLVYYEPNGDRVIVGDAEVSLVNGEYILKGNVTDERMLRALSAPYGSYSIFPEPAVPAKPEEDSNDD